ncbi:MAG: hypothetical protein MO853_07200 [Candidatus Protistobacter heckmanni]|nr:hypothetical protein [Candidatus Protistobacter heckmanni]
MALLGLQPRVALALDFGQVRVLSKQGEPLQAELDLSGVDEKESAAVRAAPVSADIYSDVGMRYSSEVADIRAAVKRRDGRSYIEIRSNAPVLTDFIDLLLTVNWPSGRSVRAVSLLVPRPEAAAAPVPEPAPAPAPAPAAAAATKPVLQPMTKPAKPPEKAPEKAPAKVVKKTPAKPAEKAAKKPAEKAPEKATPKTAESILARITDSAKDGGNDRPTERLPQAQDQRQTSAELGQSYRVEPGDTLSAIAGDARQRAGNVSLEQVLWALYESNPKAFIDENLNRVKAGAVLKLPGEREVADISREEARREIRVHSEVFERFRAGMASTATPSATDGKEPNRSSGGEVNAKVKSKSGASSDELKLSRPDAKPSEKLREEAIASERALHDAEARIVQLEKNVADLRKLVDMLQKQNAGNPPAQGVQAPVLAGSYDAATPPKPAAPAAAAEHGAEKKDAEKKDGEKHEAEKKEGAKPSLWHHVSAYVHAHPVVLYTAIPVLILILLIILVRVMRARARKRAAAMREELFSGLDLDLDAAAATPRTPPVMAMPDISLDLSSGDEPGLRKAAPAPSTKDQGLDVRLQLGQAYRDLGDIAGARKLFREVADLGNPDQKTRAGKLLADLG